MLNMITKYTELFNSSIKIKYTTDEKEYSLAAVNPIAL